MYQEKSESLNKSRIVRTGLIFVLGAILIWVFSWYASESMYRVPDFDGALNFNVSASLSKGEGYQSFYEQAHFFPIETQTNGPLVIPTALSYKFLGLNPLSSQLCNLIYLFVFLYAVFRLLELSGVAKPLMILGLILILQLPGMRDYAMNGYGEIPAFSFALLALIQLSKRIAGGAQKRTVLAGVLLGLSFLTKTVSLIWSGPIVLVYLACMFFYGDKKIIETLREAIYFALGGLFVVLLWEIYRAWSLGGISNYEVWWMTQWNEIQSQAGVKAGYGDTEGVLNKLKFHFASFADMVHLSKYLLLLFFVLCGLGAISLVVSSKNNVRNFLALALLTIGTMYFVWWLMITPTDMMWLRRIFLGLICLVLLVLVLLGEEEKKPARWITLGAGLGAIALVLKMAVPHQLLFDRPSVKEQLPALVEFHQAIAKLPKNALVFGSGWWQNPVAALFSGRQMQNEEAWTRSRFEGSMSKKYFVMDTYAISLGRLMQDRMQWRCDCEPEYIGSAGHIYSMRNLFDLEGQQTQIIWRQDAASPKPFGDGISAHDEGGIRWVNQKAQLELDRPISQFRKLVITGAMPEHLLWTSPEQTSIRVSFRAGNCDLGTRELKRGKFSILLPVQCEQSTQTIEIQSSARIQPEMLVNDSRPLAWLIFGIQGYLKSN